MKSSGSKDSNRRDDVPSDRNSNGASFNRFGEFSSSPGNPAVQDELALQLMRGVIRASSEQNMDLTISTGIQGLSDNVAELYMKSERNIVERNKDIARRTSLPQITKWNRHLIDQHKHSKVLRSEISKELAIVHALLKRSPRPSSARAVVRVSRNGDPVSISEGVTTENVDTERRTRSVPNAATAALLSAGTCTLILSSFHSVAGKDNGPAQLAQFGTVSIVLVLLAARVHALARPNVSASVTTPASEKPGHGDDNDPLA